MQPNASALCCVCAGVHQTKEEKQERIRKYKRRRSAVKAPKVPDVTRRHKAASAAQRAGFKVLHLN